MHVIWYGTAPHGMKNELRFGDLKINEKIRP